jgi:hypothetical protein
MSPSESRRTTTRSGERGIMKISRRVGATITVVLGLMLSPGAAQAQVDQAELARQLAKGGAAERYGAAYQVREMGPENAHPALREALILAFTEEAEAYRAYQRGETPVPDDLSAVGMLVTVVGHFRDPRAIQPLTNVLGTGPAAAWGLAAFGDPAVPYLVEAARSGEGSEVIVDALIGLRFLAEGVGQVPLTPSSREELIAVARERMAPEQSPFYILVWAIDLAAVLDDPRLRQTVEALAADPAEAEARLKNPSARGIEVTVERAKERLRGKPPLPRWDSYSSRPS